MASKSKHVVLSIDFDFFIHEKLEYDWGHRENGLFIQTIWPVRAMSLLAAGIDPIKDVGLTGKPDELAAQLEKLKWKIKKRSRLSVAESHASAYHALKDKTNLEIINIDAHHDISYGQFDKLDCGNWIGRLAMEGRVKKVTIIYPEWRKTGPNYDYPGDEALAKMKELGVELDIVYGIQSTYARKVDEVFIARSGAWVPPWTDDAFYAFIHTWMFRSEFFTLWGYDSLDKFKREFDLEQVKAGAKIQKQHMDEMKKLHPGAIFM